MGGKKVNLTRRHGSLGENVKIHFAGLEGEPFHVAAKCAGVKYVLYSVFKFIDTKSAKDDLTLPEDHLIRRLNWEYRHVIQDSGLFTLMFGAGKGRMINRDYLREWQDKLIKFVIQNRLECTCVEIDCQKVLGVQDAWYFRERMREMLPNRQINVFHWEDGREGLDRLIDFSDYIAISVPELRIIKPKTYKEDAVNLARYVKCKKPSIDIHMLGCTEYSMLKHISFTTSADSTSWISGVKYGFINDGNQKAHINQFKKDIVEKRKADVKAQLQKVDGYTDSKLRYATNASICASICKQRYSTLAGSQE